MADATDREETPMPAATWKPAVGKDAQKAKNPNRADRDEPVNPEQLGVAQPRDMKKKMPDGKAG